MAANTSSSEFGVPEFKTYNPNPYCGGYDLTLTYGKPLPPSHSTCYPPSFQSPPSSLNGFSYGSIPSPYGGTSPKLDQTSKPQNLDGNQNVKLVDDNISTNGHGSDESWTDYGYGNKEDSCNYGNQQNQDDLGLCPSIFGYWPCLYKMDKKIYGQNNGDEQERDHRDQWEVTAEYLFGSNLYPYGERNQVDVSYGYNSSYRYQKQKPTSVKLEYSEKSLIPKVDYYGAYQEEDECLPVEYSGSESIVPINCGNYGHYEKQQPSVHVDYSEQSSLQKRCYGQSDHVEEYPLFDYVDYYNGRSSSQRPCFDEAYGAEGFPALGYVTSESNMVTSYERHYPEQSHLLHVEYNEQCEVQRREEYPALGYGSGESNLVMSNGYERQYPEQSHLLPAEYNERSTFQELVHSEIYQEEQFPAYQYGEDFFSESSDKYNYYSYYNE